MYRSIAGLVLLIISTVLSGQDFIPEPPDPQSGYLNINELTAGYGLGNTEIPYSKYFYGFTTIHGYEFNISPFDIKSDLFVGAGAGMLFYDDGAMFPLLADLRYTIIRKKISPFVFGNGGLLISMDGIRDRSMLSVNGGAGTRIRISDKLNVCIGTGLSIQFHRDEGRDAFIHLRAGVSFKPAPGSGSGGLMVKRN